MFLELKNIIYTVILQFIDVVSYPINFSQRIYFPYLLSSMVFALFIYVRLSRQNKKQKITISGFTNFLFPAAVWKHPSAWLDVRYFFFHQMFRLVIYGVFITAISTFVYQSSVQNFQTMLSPEITFNSKNHSTLIVFLISVIYMFLSICLLDFISYCIHYAQHKIPFLWEFHKVHHSAEVMHPLTNYREHPVDNFLYAIGTGAAFGFAASIAYILLGYLPSMPQIWGVALISFAFNFLGYNLRHSHIWLRWPGKWGRLFASPAHHQIHHSYHSEHINKNFAFIFPWWDSLFGTFCNSGTHFLIYLQSLS